MTRTVSSRVAGSLALALLWNCVTACAAQPHTTIGSSTAPANQVETARAALDAARIGDIEPARALLAGPLPDARIAVLLQTQLAAARLDMHAVRETLERYFALPDDDPHRMRRARQIAAETAFAAGQYGDAAHHANLLLGMAEGTPSESLADTRRMMEIATLLFSVAPQRLETPGTGTPAPLLRDKVGLYRTPIAVAGTVEEAVIDTGANLSVASASAARRLGLKLLSGTTSIGNAVGGSVDIQIGIADRLDVAGATLENVAFVVMDDEALTFPIPGGYSIDAILGLPVLRALERLRFGPGEMLRVEPSAESEKPGGNIRLIGSSPYVVVTIEGIDYPLYLDTGATTTSLTPRLSDARPELRVTDTGKTIGKAGAGGAERIRHAQFEPLSLSVGGGKAELKEITLDTSAADEAERPYGVVGVDFLDALGSFTIDFKAMRLDAGTASTEAPQ